MTKDKPMEKEEIEWLIAYESEVLTVFLTRFLSASDRFRNHQPLLERFTSAVDAVKVNGRSVFRAVDEAHNELCIASAILENQEPYFSLLEYEPSLNSCTKTIDFRAISKDLTVYVDVKTIKPVTIDRWDQYEKAKAEEWFPNNVNIILQREWLGGELWHNMFAARSRILEYSLELEQKIAEGHLLENNTLFVLALCGEGFSWNEDELEDFVSYYYSGIHRGDDTFSQAEARNIQEKHISIARNISRFACMRRHQGEILQKRLNWNVLPPRNPHFS